MKIEKNTVVSFHYALSDEAGQPIETSRDGEPLSVLHGHGGVVPGVESALEGREPGERFEITVAPEEAYGPRREGLTQRISKKYLPNAKRLRPGARTFLSTRNGTRPVTVVKVGGSVVDVDLNHPMAGRTLRFDIEILDVRAADEAEVAHGHAHGAGGHHHG